MLQNFLFGVDAIGSNMKSIIFSLGHHPVILGFAIGFFASTGIHAIVVSEDPRHIPHILSKKPSDAFIRRASRNKEGTFETSYTQFLRKYNRVRIIFYSTALVFLVVIGLAMLRF